MSELPPHIQEGQNTLMSLAIEEARLKMQAAQEIFLKAKIERKAAEETLKHLSSEHLSDKEYKRPSRQHYIEIEYDAVKEQWVAKHQDVVAYGDTPEMACDNFDHLWVFGN